MNENKVYDLQFVNEFRKRTFEDHFVLSYRGEISQEIMLALLDMTEKKLDITETRVSIKTKVFNVMVGCLQNISSQVVKNKYAELSMFTIGLRDSGYQVFSGNAILKSNIDELETRLHKINDMSKDELKEFYKFWLQSRNLSDRETFGMGLIDIARKTGNPLDYDFEDIDDDYSYFSLRTTVSN